MVDVNKEAVMAKLDDEQESTEDVKNDAQVVAETESAPVEDGINFDEIFGSEESKQIPYGRFKQVNEEKKALKAEIDNLKAQQEKIIQDAVLRAKMEAMTSPKGKDKR